MSKSTNTSPHKINILWVSEASLVWNKDKQAEGAFGELSNTLMWWEVELQLHSLRRDRGLPRNTRTEDVCRLTQTQGWHSSHVKNGWPGLVGWCISHVILDYFSDISTLLCKILVVDRMYIEVPTPTVMSFGGGALGR